MNIHLLWKICAILVWCLIIVASAMLVAHGQHTAGLIFATSGVLGLVVTIALILL